MKDLVHVLCEKFLFSALVCSYFADEIALWTGKEEGLGNTVRLHSK